VTLELAFRIMLTVLTFALYYNRHVLHRKTSSKVKRMPTRGVELWIIIVPYVWTASLVLYVAGFEWFDYSAALPTWLRWVGVGLMAICLPLTDWTYYSLGVHASRKLELQKDHRLVQEGPYRYVRHPVYVVLFLSAIGACLVSSNIIVMITTLAVVAVVLIRIRKEEAMLIGRFGDEYLDYRRRTGALLPRLIH
jgi:protein-S-isoprenylcysteine O-methyltransferase Ste14